MLVELDRLYVLAGPRADSPANDEPEVTAQHEHYSDRHRCMQNAAASAGHIMKLCVAATWPDAFIKEPGSRKLQINECACSGIQH